MCFPSTPESSVTAPTPPPEKAGGLTIPDVGTTSETRKQGSGLQALRIKPPKSNEPDWFTLPQ